jgi:hypothetical protein
MHGLTVKRVEAVRATPARQEIADPYLRGLYLIVQPSGTKTWAVRFRLGGKSHKHTIGPYPAFSLAQAREAASAVLRSVAEGRDPKQQRTDNVARAVEQFIVHHGKHYRPKPLYEARRLLQTYVVDPWGSRRLAGISRADVRTTLYSIAAPVAANRTHSIMRKFFNWAVENDLMPASPVAGVRAPNKEKSRDRILADAELRAVWNAELGYPLGPISSSSPDSVTAKWRGCVGMSFPRICGSCRRSAPRTPGATRCRYPAKPRQSSRLCRELESVRARLLTFSPSAALRPIAARSVTAFP